MLQEAKEKRWQMQILICVSKTNEHRRTMIFSILLKHEQSENAGKCRFSFVTKTNSNHINSQNYGLMMCCNRSLKLPTWAITWSNNYSLRDLGVYIVFWCGLRVPVASQKIIWEVTQTQVGFFSYCNDLKVQILICVRLNIGSCHNSTRMWPVRAMGKSRCRVVNAQHLETYITQHTDAPFS